ncbi:MAG: GH39 family glycosyl hydrolase [Spirochaetia bacterium]
MIEKITIPEPAKRHPIDRFEHHFRECVGTGRVDLALQKSYLDALQICQNEIGFRRIRGHGILSDQAGAYQVRKLPRKVDVEDMEPPLHNFTRICRIIDNWLNTGIEPFIELGFMPSELAGGDDTVFWWKSNVTPPSDYGKWRDLVSGLVRILVKRYGLERVRTWPFEVWNEPDVGFWMPEGDKQEAYYELYRHTAEALKSVDPDIPVGGPATCPASNEWVLDHVDHCVQNGIPIDFASTHLYMIHQTRIKGEFFQGDLYPPENRLRQAEKIRDFLKRSRKADIPLHITEWNTSYSPLDLMHETTMNAAYVAWFISHADSLFDSYSYWTFSDVFEENNISSAPFHGGFGLVTEDGIRKPTFYTFAFAAELGTEVVYRSDTVLVTTDPEGGITALCYNLALDTEDAEEKELLFEVQVPWREAAVLVREVNDDAGTGFTAWKALGRPRYPGAEEMEIIRNAQYPRQTVSTAQIRNGKARAGITVPPNGIALVKLFERQDMSAEYRNLPEKEWGVDRTSK